MPLDYGPGVGTERLRVAAAAVAGCSPEDIVITHGAIEALLLACAASLESRTTVAVADTRLRGPVPSGRGGRRGGAAGAGMEPRCL